MRVIYDPDEGFISHLSDLSDPATHDIPDEQWKAYRTLVDAANAMEDRFVVEYALEQAYSDEWVTVRGILTDEQIESLKAAGVSLADVPAGKVYHEAPTKAEVAISVEEAAQRIIRANAHKCQHRNQMGPFDDGTVRCRDCGGVLYGGTGVRKVNDPDDPRHFHNPGTVDPRRFEGNVK